MGQTLYPISTREKGLISNLPLIYPQNGDANEDPMRNDVIRCNMLNEIALVAKFLALLFKRELAGFASL